MRILLQPFFGTRVRLFSPPSFNTLFPSSLVDNNEECEGNNVKRRKTDDAISGQNVNKLNTKATLRLVSAKTAWIPSRIREQLSLSHAGYVTKEGDLLISSQRNRTQEANREDCFQKLASLIVDAGSRGVQGETTVETREKVGRMMKRGNEQRLKGKKIQSAKKGARRSRGGDD